MNDGKIILVAVGANLPGPAGQTPLQMCQAAARMVCQLPGIAHGVVSDWYATAPVPPSGQPDYVNGVVRLEGWIDPPTLLAALQNIEHQAGRVRGELNAARVLDLDILAMGDLVRGAFWHRPGAGMAQILPDPVLPHPRAHERQFVLRPLMDVAPDWVHPVLGRGVRDLLGALPDQGVRPIPIF